MSISSEEYYRALSISEDHDYELHLIQPPISCFVNNYFSHGLKSWQANMDIWRAFNEYKAVTYMCSYFSKSEDQCPAAMKQSAKEALNNELGCFDTMKNILQAYTSKQECSVQEAVYHVLPELHFRRVFPSVYFVNTNLPEEHSKILRTEEELKNLPDNSTTIFKRNTLDRYMDRPDHSFSQGRYRMLNSFCFAEFVSCYTIIYKPIEVDQNDDYQPHALPESPIEGNYNCCNYLKIIKLMNSTENMCCRKLHRVLSYHTPNNQYPEKYAIHHLLLLFYPFRSENELFGGTSHTYQAIF